MRTIEILRHSYTNKGESRGKGSHLSAMGIKLARQIGEQVGIVDLVLTSQIQRSLETAIAMGFAVDDQLAVLGEIPLAVWDEIGHQERWEWQNPFLKFAEIIVQGGATALMGVQQQQAWIAALESIPTDGKVLIISHGRVIESGLVTIFPDGDFAAWGTPFHHCEGVQMQYQDGRFSNLTFRRIDQDSIHNIHQEIKTEA